MNCMRVSRWRFGDISLCLLSVIISGCSYCENKNFTETGSPDGQLVAVSYDALCGAGVSNSINVSIKRKNSGSHQDVFSCFPLDSEKVRIEWTSNRNLKVISNCCKEDRISLKKTQAVGIVIAYECGDPAVGDGVGRRALK